MSREFETKGSTKIRDIWAFLLFVVLNVALDSYTHLVMNQGKFNLIYPDSYFGMAFVSAIMFFTIFSLLIIYIPTYTMHLSIWVAIIGLPAIAAFSRRSAPIICACIFSFFFLIDYLFNIRKNIKYAASLIHEMSNIFIFFIPLIYMSATFFSLLGIAHIYWLIQSSYASTLKMTFYNQHSWVLAANVFRYYWFFFGVFYATRIYIASLTSNIVHGVQSITKILGRGFQRVLASIGTAFFGALLIAILYTLRYYVSLKTENARDQRRNILVIILGVVCEVILSLLTAILDYANKYSMIHCAIYGTGYTASFSESFERVKYNEKNIFVFLRCLYPVIFAILFLFNTASMWVLYTFTDKYRNAPAIDNLKIAASAVLMTFILYAMLSMFEAAMMTVLYIYCDKKNVLQASNPKVVQIIERRVHEVR